MQVWSVDDNSFIDDENDEMRKTISLAKKYIELRRQYLENPSPDKPFTIGVIIDALKVDAKTAQEIIEFAENDLGEYEKDLIRTTAQERIDIHGNIIQSDEIDL